MTTHDDLATLRDMIEWEASPVQAAALSRLETELARLEAERDFWEERYKQEHRTRHAMEDEIARLREGLRRIAPVAIAAWYATGGTPGHDPNDAWNDLCGLLEDEPDSFPDDARSLLADNQEPARIFPDGPVDDSGYGL